MKRKGRALEKANKYQSQDQLIEALRAYWRDHPDWRFGQLIANMLLDLRTDDPYYLDDSKFVEFLK
jgi:hypothetical protein